MVRLMGAIGAGGNDMSQRHLVFTDLDGTLLDHYSYSFVPAQEALALCRARGAPVVANTSKTHAEMGQWAVDLGLSAPYIVENGAAIVFLPQAQHLYRFDELASDGSARIELSPRRDEVLSRAEALLHEWQHCAQPFSQMTAAALMRLTGLAESAAQQALTRDYSEPMHWTGSVQELQVFAQQARGLGLRATRGGRFVHLQGDCDKGRALRALLRFYELAYPSDRWLSVALGDGDNDISMLQAADVAVRVKSPVHHFPEIGLHPRCLSTTAYGPAGWNQAVLSIMEEEHQHG